MPDVLGVRVDILSRQAVREKILHYLKAESSTSHFIVTANVELYYQAAKQPELKQVLNSADLCVPDSTGIIWALYRQGINNAELYPGIELAEWLLGLGESVYVLGAQEAVVSKLTQKNIIGRHHGFFNAVEEKQIINEINRLKPKIVLVGLGAGKQELWIAKNKDHLDTCILIGIGGSIDVLSGFKKRAPLFWRKLHLEWLYRLLKEPSRWRRQTVLFSFWCTIRKNIINR